MREVNKFYRASFCKKTGENLKQAIPTMRNGIARLPLSELNRTEQNTAKPLSWKSPRDSEYTRAFYARIRRPN